jgi:hypothetical protein
MFHPHPFRHPLDADRAGTADDSIPPAVLRRDRLGQKSDEAKGNRRPTECLHA